MKVYNLKIQNKIFKVAVAQEEDDLVKGVSGLTKLGPDKGMLFIFPEKIRMSMTMKDTSFALDFLFIDENWIVQEYGTRAGGGDNITPVNSYSMVLELPMGTIDNLGISEKTQLEPSQELITQYKGVQMFKCGGKFERVGEKIYKIADGGTIPIKGKMQLLDKNGNVALNIDAGARIFSREHTAELLRLKVAGNTTAIAQLMLEILDKQDNQKQEYVSSN